ncbi:hypothetical protein COO60DRAFT_1705216 [Scenedesmus sp. NREL 46B-D3]|nr:hypothetical protein COO60DRAFT_1705216 [Scenedesmus sp. NREL 46B-D3]
MRGLLLHAKAVQRRQQAQQAQQAQQQQQQQAQQQQQQQQQEPRRAKIITQRLQQLGAAVRAAPITTATRPIDLASSVSHIVLHPSDRDGSSSGGGGGSRSSGIIGQQGAAASVQQVLDVMQQLRQLQAQRRPSHRQQQQQQQQYIVRLVSDEWLDAVLSAGQYVPEQQYSLEGLLESPGGSSSGDDSVHEHHWADLEAAACHLYALWLGRWERSFDQFTTQVEVVLHGSFDASDSAARGPNEAVRAALKELEAFEVAVAVKDAGWGPGAIAHEALTYAHAAAVVRGCCFPLSPALSPKRLQQLLPFVGAFTARTIHQLLTTGTCEQLGSFRANQPVRNSQGQPRPGTAGGAARAAFVKLPGVGPALAEVWWNAGYSSLPGLLRAAAEAGLLVQPAAAAGAGSGSGAVDVAHVGCSGVDGSAPGVTAAAQSLPRQVRAGQPDAAAAAAAGGGGGRGRGRGAGGSSSRHSSMTTAAAAAAASTTGGGAAGSVADASAAGSAAAVLPFGREALYSLRYNGDLLSGTVSAGELEEMRQFLLESLAAVTGVSVGWKLQLVGGGRRSSAVHDVDYLVGRETNDSLLVGLVGRLYSRMVAAGRVVAEDEGFCRVQHDRMPAYKEKARMDVLLGRFDSNHQMDHYDHLWCIHISPAGRRRRWDLMFVPSCYWAMAVVGWSGSKQYLRFMRQHAGNCGMSLNSHYLMRAVNLLPGARHTAAASPSGAAVSSGGVAAAAAPTNPAAAAAAAAVAAQSEDASSGGRSSKPSASGSLAEAVEYAGAAAASGSIRVVLSVPDEAPPTDRHGNEWWPPGWQPAHASAAAAQAGVSVGSEAGSGDAAVAARGRTQLAALVESGPGSARSILREQDLFELLGVPYLEPNQRNC